MIEKTLTAALRNRLVTLVLIVLVMAAGFVSYRDLPVDAFPDVSPNLVQVFTVTEGLAPEEVETYVTYPVEAAMTGLPGIEEIRSISNFGLSVVSVYFDDSMDIYFTRQLVNERLQAAREQIPDGFGEPEMGPIATGMGLILYYTLEDRTGTHSLTELRTLQDWIVKMQLQTVPGVTEVLGIGGHEKQYQVNLDPQALLRYDLAVHDVISRIRANNLNVGAQFLERNGEQFLVRSEGLAHGVDDLANIVLVTDDGRPVYLRDVADVEVGGAIRRGLQTMNGDREVVSGMVIQLYGTNASTVIERVEAKLAEVQDALPEGVEIVPYYEQSQLVQASVSTVRNALVQGVGLVALVLLLFLGAVRPAVVVALAIPFSVLFATLAMGWFGISANLMSLGGLAIAIGIMVDGTIVMVENIDRLMQRADPQARRIDVVLRACREVARPIVFAIAIIIVAFLPLFTLQGVEGKTFRPLAYTVALAMLGSLVYAVTAAPVFADLFMRRRRAAGGVGVADRILGVLLRGYRPLLYFFLGRRVWAVALSVVLLVAGAAVLPRLGSEFTPRLNEGDIMINGTMAPSIALSESKEITLRMERRVLALPEVEKVVTRVGRGEVGAHSAPVNVIHSNVVLAPRSTWPDPGKTQPEIESDIRAALADFPGMATNITQPIQLTVDELVGGVKAELAIQLFGDDLDLLKEKGDEIAAVVREIDGAADVQAAQMVGAPQLLIRPDREALARYGIDLGEAQETIQAAIGGVSAGQVFDGIRRFDIYVRYQEPYRDSQKDVERLLVTAPTGERIPLADLADIRTLVGPRQITRENAQRFVTVQANVVGRDIGSFVEEARRTLDAESDLPPGYFVTWGGQFELAQQANRRLMLVVPVTLGLICLMLYVNFDSLKDTALILLNIPLALVGGVLALWIAGENLSVPASVGFIALFGIALENGMVLVTYTNQLVRDGMPVDRASAEGALLRVRPVLMTALTTSLGLIPLLLATGTGSEVQRPLATVVVGGLVTSTVLTLLVLPAFYRWFAGNVAEEKRAVGL